MVTRSVQTNKQTNEQKDGKNVQMDEQHENVMPALTLSSGRGIKTTTMTISYAVC